MSAQVLRFEELTFWVKGKELSVLLYRNFWGIKDYWFKDQIQRAWVSISNNIAEGFERQTNKEFRQFLYIAKWSCGEVRSMLSIWKELWYISQQDYTTLYNMSVEISKVLRGFIKTLK